MKKSNITVSVFFLLILGILTVSSIFNPVRESSESENRELAQMPALSLESLFDSSDKGFTKGYEKFVTDQFVWRDGWITVKNSFDKLLGKTVFNNVYLADDGYFIEYRSAGGLDAEALDRIENNIGYLKEYSDKMNEKLTGNTVIAIAPTAALIHADKLPRFNDEYDWKGLLDRIEVSVGESYADLYTTLQAHKDEYIYYRTDHHWTTDGAYLAYVEIIKEFGFEPIPKEDFDRVLVADDFYGTIISKVNMNSAPDEIYAFEPKSGFDVKVHYESGIKDSFYNEEKLATKDKYAYFFGGNPGFMKIESNNAESDRVLVLAKDSYANCMIPLLSCHFSKIYVIDLREFNVNLGDYVNTEVQSDIMKPYGIIDATDTLVLYNASSLVDARELFKLP